MFASPSQIIFTVFGIDIYYYGLIMAVAIAISIFAADLAGVKYFNLKKDTAVDLAPYIIILGLIGARLYYCVMDYSFYLRFPTEILAFRHGGLSIHGAIIGGFFGILLYAKRHNIPLKKLCDMSVIGLSLGQAIGRWGNFFNSEAYGSPTNLPWKLYIAPQYRQIPFLDNEYFHPAFLYESILDLFIFCILLYLLKTAKNKRDGNLTLVYLILYSIARIIVESIRIDSVRYILGLPVATFISICIIFTAVLLLIKNNISQTER